MEKILLHTCCAPCSASTITLLQEYEIVSLWFNPNIYPLKEHLARYDTWNKYMDLLNIQKLEIKADWLDDETKYEDLWLNDAVKCDKGRCYYCYLKRLEKTVETAKQNNIKNFSTTLLSSPYQKHDVIKQMCEELATKNGLNFVYVDPRKIHYDGVHKIKKLGLYSQRYCGCKLSIR